MRKGYGPSGISYILPLDKFVTKVRDGLHTVVSNEGDKPETIEIPRDLEENFIELIYNDADCVCYLGAFNEGIEAVVPSKFA